MINLQTEFYAIIGKLSILFAKMEFKTSEIITRLINSDEETISVYLIERNNLQKNLELLIKFNNIRDIANKEISIILPKIDKIKNDRNLFVHGLWSDPVSDVNNKKVAVCEERKIKYSSEGYGKLWRFNKHFRFTFDELLHRISELEDIIATQDRILKTIDNEYL